MHSLQGIMWTHACVSVETERTVWKAAETAGNTEKLPEKQSCMTWQDRGLAGPDVALTQH
jgi:hypothetical protein